MPWKMPTIWLRRMGQISICYLHHASALVMRNCRKGEGGQSRDFDISGCAFQANCNADRKLFFNQI
jgi:hypothetical protein